MYYVNYSHEFKTGLDALLYCLVHNLLSLFEGTIQSYNFS